MSDRLPVPIRRVLREPFDDAALERSRAMLRKRAPEPRHSLRRAAFVAIAAAVLVGVVVFASEHADVSGPLLLSDGRAVPATLASDTTTIDRALSFDSDVSFEDGSAISLTRGAVLRMLENDEREIGFLLDQGTATFDVRPGGSRRWTIECGLATVVVVGTRFTIERTTERARIAVSRGAVLVRGERVPDRAQRLGAGESLVIDVPPIPRAPEPMAEASPSAEPESDEDTDVLAVRAVPDTRPASWRALASAGDWESAFAELGDRGIARASRTASAEELAALADVARLSGHPSAAVPPLEQLVSQHPRDPSAPFSAFSLGRVEGQLGRHDRAARAFALALDLGLPPPLRADALARLATSHLDAGDHAAAIEASSRYLREFPDGSRAEAMRGIGALR